MADFKECDQCAEHSCAARDRVKVNAAATSAAGQSWPGRAMTGTDGAAALSFRAGDRGRRRHPARADEPLHRCENRYKNAMVPRLGGHYPI